MDARCGETDPSTSKGKELTMNKMLVAVFDSESAAYEGLTALKDLHKNRDITLYATAVIAKDQSGVVREKQVADEGPIGAALGLLTGSLVGVLGGPVGLAVGASAGTLTGWIFDLAKSGIDLGFLDEVIQALSPGKAAVLAEVEETWVTPVNTKLAKLGGLVFRRLRSEVVEDQLARESAAFNAELKQLKEELAQASGDAKVAVQRDIDAVKRKLEVMQVQAMEKTEQAKHEVDAKINTLREQIKLASDSQKAKLEKQTAKIKADYEARKDKLERAHKLAKEALW
jgi:uncharacterized membrane protein